MSKRVKIFDKPIKTTGYLNDLDLFELLDFETDFRGYMIIKQKYTTEEEYETFFARFDCQYGFGQWETDWYEGQQEVYLLGYFYSPSELFFDDFDRLFDFLKEESKRTD